MSNPYTVGCNLLSLLGYSFQNYWDRILDDEEDLRGKRQVMSDRKSEK